MHRAARVAIHRSRTAVSTFLRGPQDPVGFDTCPNFCSAAGEIAIPCTNKFVNPNETVAVQLKDGSVMLNARNESSAGRRIVVTSPDGATRWSQPHFQNDLVDPVCMAGLVRYTHGGEDVLLFSNPDTPPAGGT